MKPVTVLVVGALAVAVAACASSSTRHAGTSTRAGGKDAHYLIRPRDQWTLKEAIDPPPGSLATKAEPSLDWYAEYEKSSTNESQQVRVSGHAADIDTVRARLMGFQLKPTTVGTRPALAGTSTDPAGPSVVLFSMNTTYTAMVLSYELNVEDLINWAATLTPATQAQWIASGGRVEH